MNPILITGASRGLGAAMSLALASRQTPLVLVARTVGALQEIDDAITAKGCDGVLAPLDITDDGALQHLCRSIYDRWGGISGWVHAAIHAAPLTPALHIQSSDLEKSIAVNVTATARLISYVSPLLGHTGRVLFFDDPCAGIPYFGTYGSTKAAQIALAQSWQAETVRTGPFISVLRPRPMPTATRARFHPGEDRTLLSDPAQEAARLVTEWERGSQT